MKDEYQGRFSDNILYVSSQRLRISSLLHNSLREMVNVFQGMKIKDRLEGSEGSKRK